MAVLAMKDRFRQSMAWLHTWTGLSVCWVLLLVFAAGTASFYKEEITFWMQPELHAGVQASAQTNLQPARPVALAAASVQMAMATLQTRAPHATRWQITLPGERNATMGLRWTMAPEAGASRAERRERARQQSITLDAASGLELPAARATRGGDFLYRLHFDLHYMPALWARWLVGACAMFMLVAIISGVITHKHIFKDFFTFRPKKGSRSWLDAHNALAVLALPFHLMITYTGLVTLMLMFMPAPGKVMFPDDDKAFAQALFPADVARIKPSGVAQPLTDVAPLLALANRQWSQAPSLGAEQQAQQQVARIRIDHPGDENARITLSRQAGSQLSNKEPSLVFNGVDGALIGAGTGERIAAGAEKLIATDNDNSTFRSFYGLHLAHFAHPALRALFFLCGLAGCAMVATGALLWAVKERKKCAKALANGARIGYGLRLVEALNIGAIAGLPIAFGAYFWSNRLLPVEMPERVDAEALCFFAAWGCALVLAQISPTRSMWRLQLSMGALLLAGIPVLNALTTTSHLGLTLFGATGLSAVAGFDLVTLALGLLLAGAAWSLGRATLSTTPATPAKPNQLAGEERR
jgi:uncharacterized iron-regulated membrane protein